MKKKILQKALETELKLLKLSTEHLQKEILRLQKYKMEHGDLYARFDDTGEIKTRSDGTPVTVELPTRWTNARKATLDLVTQYNRTLEEMSKGNSADDEGDESGETREGSIVEKYKERFKRG